MAPLRLPQVLVVTGGLAASIPAFASGMFVEAAAIGWLIIGMPIIIMLLIIEAWTDLFGLRRLAMLVLVAMALGLVSFAAFAAPDLCQQYRARLTREAQAVYGINAPIPMLIGQLRQESSCRAGVTAWDHGRGLAQFMDPTTSHVTKLFPELGPADPYDERWAIRAFLRYDSWLFARVKGDNLCDRWAATLKSYNAGLGYVQRAQRRSPHPGVWFKVTENINAGQSQKNFIHSRDYPHVVLFKHQPRYTGWGNTICLGEQP